MTVKFKTIAALAIWLGTALAQSGAVTVPFSEDFVSDTANWKDIASLDVTHVANGGPGGGPYVTTDAAFTSAVMGGVIAFRGHDNFNSSDDAFVGDWLAADVRRLSAFVQHAAPEPLQFFARIATPFNFPGITVAAPTMVPPGTWVQLEFEISSTNPLLTVEGPPTNYNATLSNVGNVQFGARVPAALAADPTEYTFDLDQVSIAVPEPAGIPLVITAAVIGAIWRASRRR